MERVSFTLTYSALKMFGKQLYSNVGSALSELVANGIDAGARNVFLTIDIRDKQNSYVEVFDDGKGMSVSDIKEHYIVIGYNKRKKELGLDNGKTMGRKGIGKLAALYLSNKFTIITKQKDSNPTAWMLDITGLQDDDTPELHQCEIEEIAESIDLTKLLSCGSGTIISLSNVNLRGLGDRAFESLQEKLSNFFLFDDLDQHILINIIENDDDIGKFKPIKKHIAYKNLAYVYTDKKDRVKECENNKYFLPYRTKTGEDKKMHFDTEIADLANERFGIEGDDIFFGIQKHYKLEGWVGIHASIDNDIAKANDARYIKNRFYNPNQLRLYVRNKLALANMIEHLGITRAFANYIEGEVSFDILDDDDLPDIATAGRQDFDTQDPRFQLLKDILTRIGNSLVSKRQLIADRLSETKKKADMSISSMAKTIFRNDFRTELDSLNISNEDKRKIEDIVNLKLEGEINLEAKAEYTVFLSHSKKDRIFSDFFYFFLKHLGFNGDLRKDDCEIFYSSSGLDSDNLTPLSLLIKDYIIRKNNDILFITSSNFGKSEYCLFEGGAAWATRSVGDYKIMALDYDSIPVFLTNGKSEVVFDIKSRSDFELNEEKYNNIVVILNRLINHLNKNREIKGLPRVTTYNIVEFPDLVELEALGKTIRDYMDDSIKSYWDTYVIKQVDAYLKENEENY